MNSTHRRRLTLLMVIGLLVFAACKPASEPVGAGKNRPELVMAPPALAAAEQQAGTVPVVVAAVDLPAGTLIREPEKQLVVKAFLADTAPDEGARLSNIEDARNKTVGRTLAKGEPVTARDFSYHSSIFRPAPPGLRAVTLKLELEAAVGGFTLPGSRVDVIAMGVKDAKPAAWVVLQNILVLAVDQTDTSYQPGKELKVPKDRPTLITVAVKPLDGLKLAQTQAAPGTRFTLMLRRPGDDEDFPIPGEKP